jgi:hypothetical protein
LHVRWAGRYPLILTLGLRFGKGFDRWIQ